ncbi:MAG: alginate export family protein [Candidatus Competibacteraceae bacterium]|nr:alginate export family protein [Candidatus Competibacteraceae bacterium]
MLIFSVTIWAREPTEQLKTAIDEEQQLQNQLEEEYSSDETGFELELEIAGEQWRRLTLGEEADDEQGELGLELTASLEYPLSPRLTFFGEIIGLIEKQWDDAESAEYTDRSLERGELWLRWQPPANDSLAIQFGSQTFNEPREWWWEEDLDALRLDYNTDHWEYIVALAKETTPRSTLDDDIHPEEDDLVRALGYLGGVWAADQRLKAFALMQRDRSYSPPIGVIANQNDASDADLNWLGSRACGLLSLRNFGTLAYRFDGAWVWGHERLYEFAESDAESAEVTDSRRRDVRGWALDVGGTWALPLADEPRLFFGYALGSGDTDPDGDIDRSFRQTGLQENETLFRYYGELFYPELSNLRVFSVGVHWPVLDNGLLTLAHHRYRQDVAAPYQRETGIDRDPEGDDPELGWEWDVVFTLETEYGLSFQAITSVFEAGGAYGDAEGERAYRSYLNVIYEF